VSIAVVCSKCAAKLNAPDGAAGKNVKCPKCQTAMFVPIPLPEEPGFEEVDEPAPAKKPAPKSAAKAKVKARAIVDDDEEDEKPRKKRVQAETEDDDEEDRPRKKRRKKQEDDEEGNSRMTRNIIGGVVLLILLGVAGWVFYDKFGKKKDDDTAGNSGGNPPPANRTPPQAGPAPITPGGNPPPPKKSGPNSYTGEGITGGTLGEVEAFAGLGPALWAGTPGQRHLWLSDQVVDWTKTYLVYLKPDQWSKIDQLWPGQKVKIRARIVQQKGAASLINCYAAEIISTSPPPEFVEMTVDEVLKEFRTNNAAIRQKWTGDKAPWIKLTGTFDSLGAKPGGEYSIAPIILRGTEADGKKPNRIIVDMAVHDESVAKALKPGDRVTVRFKGGVWSPDPKDEGQIHLALALMSAPTP
jgi:LSD1 subclass zinc finger protein